MRQPLSPLVGELRVSRTYVLRAHRPAYDTATDEPSIDHDRHDRDAPADRDGYRPLLRVEFDTGLSQHNVGGTHVADAPNKKCRPIVHRGREH